MKCHGKDVPFKNKIRSKTTHRAIVIKKLFDIPFRGASNNALSGLVKPPAMRMVTDFQELRSSLDKVTLKKASKLTGIPEDVIRNTSLLLTKPGNCCIVCGKDVEEDPLGENTIKALLNLCALINAVHHTTTGTDKVSILFSRANNNSQGVNDMGVVRGFFPGYIDINDAANRGRIEKLWCAKLAADVSQKGPVNIIGLALNGKLKAFYVMGENPIVNYPNPNESEECQKLGGVKI